MSRRPSLLLAALSGLLVACTTPPSWEGNFDIPIAAAVIEEGPANPFSEPLGYGVGLHGGQIAIMSLREGRYLTDTADVSFVRASPLAAGQDRIIGALAAYAPGDDVIDVFAADRAYAQLLRVPHVLGRDNDGVPIRYNVSATDPVFHDNDSSGDNARLEPLVVRNGYTSTEDWLLEYDGEQWWVYGSRSGRQEYTALMDESYSATRRTVEFTVTGTASAGDTITFSTDSGIEEFDIGGVPLLLSMSADQTRLMAVVVDDAGEADLVQIDPRTGDVKEIVALPAGATPHRMAWDTEGLLYVADLNLSAVHEVDFASGTPVVTTHPLPWPILDVAPLTSAAGTLLYVAPVGGRSAWILDAETDTLIDINPQADGVQGMDFDTPVLGLEAIPMTYQFRQTDDDGVRLWGRSVAVSLYTGRVVFMTEGTGCLVQDELGPRTALPPNSTSGADYTTSDEVPTSYGPYLESNGAEDRHVLVNRCGGIAITETWTAQFKRDLQAWEVEGTRAGVQRNLAYEDRRYVSDQGEVSFTIRSGVIQSEEGWRFAFNVQQGVTAAEGDNDSDADREVEFDLPDDPVFFHYEDTEGGESGWETVLDRPWLLVPATNSDLYGKVDPMSGDILTPFW